MNTHLKKLSFALLGLALAGAAHAATVPVSSTIDLAAHPAAQTIFAVNPTYGSDSSSTYYQLGLSSAGTSSVSIDYFGTLPNSSTQPNQPVTYTVWTETGSSGGQATLGTQVGTMTLSPSSTSWLLSLAAGAEYILEVVLNATTQATAFNISDPVSAVPLPGTALLFGTALLGGIGFMRRRGQKGNAAVAA